MLLEDCCRSDLFGICLKMVLGIVDNGQLLISPAVLPAGSFGGSFKEILLREITHFSEYSFFLRHKEGFLPV